MFSLLGENESSLFWSGLWGTRFLASPCDNEFVCSTERPYSFCEVRQRVCLFDRTTLFFLWGATTSLFVRPNDLILFVRCDNEFVCSTERPYSFATTSLFVRPNDLILFVRCDNEFVCSTERPYSFCEVRQRVCLFDRTTLFFLWGATTSLFVRPNDLILFVRCDNEFVCSTERPYSFCEVRQRVCLFDRTTLFFLWGATTSLFVRPNDLILFVRCDNEFVCSTERPFCEVRQRVCLFDRTTLFFLWGATTSLFVRPNDLILFVRCDNEFVCSTERPYSFCEVRQLLWGATTSLFVRPNDLILFVGCDNEFVCSTERPFREVRQRVCLFDRTTLFFSWGATTSLFVRPNDLILFVGCDNEFVCSTERPFREVRQRVCLFDRTTLFFLWGATTSLFVRPNDLILFVRCDNEFVCSTERPYSFREVRQRVCLFDRTTLFFLWGATTSLFVRPNDLILFVRCDNEFVCSTERPYSFCEVRQRVCLFDRTTFLWGATTSLFVRPNDLILFVGCDNELLFWWRLFGFIRDSLIFLRIVTVITFMTWIGVIADFTCVFYKR